MRYPTGMVSRPTIQDLAKSAGVSVATVDRVLNRRLPVREDTVRLVVEAAERIGFHATSLLKRRMTELPTRRFGFLLQKPYSFYQLLGQELVAAAKTSREVDAKPILEYMDEVSPAFVVKRINELAPKVDTLAVVTMDNPMVNQVIDAIVASGKPVFTLLSPVSTSSITGHFGLDSRKCGRIAGWSIHRMAKKTGPIGILVGSHRYLNQETSEISFRSYMREHAPQFTLLEPIINLDDERIAYEAVQDMIARHDDLVAIYAAGGGQDGFIRALRETPSERRPIAVCNELIPSTKAALHDGIVDLTVGTPSHTLAVKLVESMAKACAAPHLPHYAPFFAPPDIYISENS